MQSHHRVRSSWRVFALCAGVTAGVSACADASSMFTGVWKSEVALATPWLSGRPELSIGHFGPELTGVIRFLDDEGLPGGSCACAFVEQQDVDLGGERFVATTDLCDDETLLIWEMRLEDGGAESRLIGTVRRANDDLAPAELVTFRLDDRFVSDDRRECLR